MKKRAPKHVFGPVPSRRLGRSLGIDVVPFKTCSYDCIYCQLGRTTCKTVTLSEYVPVDDVLSEVDSQLAAEMLATTLGMDLDAAATKSWDEKRESWRMSGRIVDTRSITQSAIGDKGGAWTTVLAAAVLLSETQG